ncbi:KUP system potassium uptake protein [Cupriavidus basilensis OR16]|uniref:Probable potassium transport system protein Kup n=1 Tax=Cupriavidus basilensis OR16 TaxID=1127483 RepID=H1S9E2_9BURK|nr:KUP/HAK/KT family potassium transporter [Cupriavidus basilensis]EHP40866.1 KUP system potassium uptake protein [Cupriavidus basilensis OR16]
MPQASALIDTPAKTRPGLAVMGLSALGVVFGDIGTSPLYTLKTVLALSGGKPSAPVILGLLSLLIWTLIIVTTVKYVSFAMRIDNNGEGGILALMSLLGIKKRKRPLVVAAGLFGAALIYGDGAITPAISVLSALEGLNIVFPEAKSFILPATVAILVALFAIQPMGTSRIGRAFGPVMALWFLCIAVLGIRGILLHPSILIALNPLYGLAFLFSNGYTSFLIFLCVTGAEALYADMGHFGPRPIRLAWSAIVFPSLLLNYAGQAALVLSGVDSTHNIFYLLCPPPLLVPLVILAAVATVIASQSIITGAFSMTRQAILLGWLPHLQIRQTSEQGYGQIYVGTVNWLLMLVTVSLALFFKSSDQLASAYGIAVSLTMLMTSVLLFIAMRDIWGWNLWASAAVSGVFLIIDSGFFVANLAKMLDGGYIPLMLAAVVYGVMLIWHRGTAAISAAINEDVMPIEAFLGEVQAKNIPRVPGAGVFLTRTLDGTPPVMLWHVKRNHALQQKILALSVVTQTVPWIKDAERLTLTELMPDVWRLNARYGFMERPDIPKLLLQPQVLPCALDLGAITYYMGLETIVLRESDSRMPRWQGKLFALMVKNGMHVTDLFRLPSDQVVEIGRRVSI